MPILRDLHTSHQEVDTEGSWAISYGDMITLLLTFFILFFSTDHKKDRMEAMEASLLAVLNSHSKAAPAAKGGGLDPSIETSLQEKLRAQTHRLGSRLIIEFPDVSFFAFGAIGLTKEGERELRKFVSLYQPYAGNYLIGIRAYTDNKKVQPHGTARYQDNLELSALRSVAAMRSLQKLGIPLNRMRLGAYGELRLTEADLAKAIKEHPEYDQRGLALARKVVLIIEPEPRESL